VRRFRTIAAGDLITVRFRKIGACAVALLAASGLAACQTKAGAAAVVDGHRISQSDVNKYVDAAYVAPSPSPGAQQPQQQAPRVIVLNTLIESRLMSRLLGSLGSVPSDGDLHNLHDEAYSVQLGAQQTGPEADAALNSALTKAGLKASFTDAFVQNLELKQAVIDKIKAQRQSDISAAVAKLGVKVSVSGRYGTWSAEQGSLVDYVPPAGVQLGTPAPASSAPAPG
jgi:hypothetical protein